MRLAVCIPWRSTPDRVRPFGHVCSWYAEHLPGVPVVPADAGGERFSRAGSRNEAVRRAQASGADTVVLADADTIPDPMALRSAIAASGDGALHFALDRMAYLDEETTEAVYRGETVEVDAIGHDSSVYVITVESYWAAGGQDERFTGYGGEDNAFTAACETLVGAVWHPGLALSLWHDGSCRDVGSSRWWADTVPLHRRYQTARGNRAAMQALTSERGRHD